VRRGESESGREGEVLRYERAKACEDQEMPRNSPEVGKAERQRKSTKFRLYVDFREVASTFTVEGLYYNEIA
jgi:hypothetical protein